MSKKGRKKRPVEERFWEKVEVLDEEECWEWTAGKTKGGYGIFYRDGKNQLAHRAAFELYYGEPIPEGRVICHGCDNPSCVNPHHLSQGTQFANMQDKISKGRHYAYEKLCKKHTPEEIRLRVLTGTWNKEKQQEILRKLQPWEYGDPYEA